jgi:prevent-host-death family protein
MTLSFMTSASFNQNPSKAKQAANDQPVVITDHGKPTHVLVTYEQFEANWQKSKTLAEALGDPNGMDLDFDPPRLSFEGRAEVEF